MPSGIDENGNYYYVRSGLSLSDTHGDYSDLHLREFEDVANQIVDEKLNQLAGKLNEVIPSTIEEYGRIVWRELITELVGVLQTDITSQVNVGFEGLKDVFYGEKCQKYISDRIMETALKEIERIKYTMK